MRNRENVPDAPVVGCRKLPSRPVSPRKGSIARCRSSPGLVCRRSLRGQAWIVLVSVILFLATQSLYLLWRGLLMWPLGGLLCFLLSLR